MKHQVFAVFIMVAFIFSACCHATATNTIIEPASVKNLDLRTMFPRLDAAFILLDMDSKKMWQYAPERCQQKSSPCSTFKIPNTLIALETGVATGADFMLPWDGTQHPIKPWNKDQTLRSAFTDSCVWFYKEIARRINAQRMQHFLDLFTYGNMDISAGIDCFWLSSSLLISPMQQLDFLYRLKTAQVPVSPANVQLLLDLMYHSEKNGVTVRGKTGTAGDPVKQVAVSGWYVGYAEYGKRNFAFVTFLTGKDNPSGRHARDIIVPFLLNFIPKLKF